MSSTILSCLAKRTEVVFDFELLNHLKLKLIFASCYVIIRKYSIGINHGLIKQADTISQKRLPTGAVQRHGKKSKEITWKIKWISQIQEKKVFGFLCNHLFLSMWSPHSCGGSTELSPVMDQSRNVPRGGERGESLQQAHTCITFWEDYTLCLGRVWIQILI